MAKVSKTTFDLAALATDNPLVYVNEAKNIMTEIDSSMSSTDLRAAKAYINAQRNNADSERKRLKRLMLNMFEEKFTELYETDLIDDYHKEVSNMMDAAIKHERELELAKIEQYITEENNGQVERSQLPQAKLFIGKSESYIKSYIDDRICDILFIEEENEVAPEPQTETKPEVVNKFNVTFTIVCNDKDLAKEINTLCRKAGDKVKVTTKKG